MSWQDTGTAQDLEKMSETEQQPQNNVTNTLQQLPAVGVSRLLSHQLIMSRHPSPGPSAQPAHHPPSVSARQKQPKPYAVGIAAGAEDVKYQTKYKELKRKVKDIESDNDKLHFKLLQAKRSIQRMKVERAVLYERLSSSTPPPDPHDRYPMRQMQHPAQPLPPYQQPIRGHPGSMQHREIRDHPPSGDDLSMGEYLRSQSNSRAPAPPDARHLSGVEYPIGPAVASSPHMVHSPRRTASGHDAPRQLPPLQQLPSVPIEIPRTHSLPPSHASPPIHHAHVPSSNERSRSHHSRGPPYMPVQNQPPYSDSRTSPLLSERERPRRHDVHEMNEPHNFVRHQTPGTQPSPSLHSADRSTTRVHNHQSMGPGAYMTREEQHDRQQDLERDREWERSREMNRNREYSSSRMHSPPLLHRSRSAMEHREHSEHRLPTRIREDPDYYHDAPRSNYSIHQRPDSPGSRSGSGEGQRPDTLAQHYESERSRPYRLRPVNAEDVEYMHHDDGRLQNRDPSSGGGGNIPQPPQEPSRTPAEATRKRTRHEMDVDSDPENESPENLTGRGASGYMSGRVSDDRSVKRYHLPRNVDNHEDSRMGPP